MEEKIIIQKRPPKSPAAAGILAGLFPFGIGAMYNGLYLKGIIYLFIFAGLVTMQGHGKGQPFFGLVLAGFYFYQIIESVQTAGAINRRALTGKEDETVEDRGPDPRAGQSRAPFSGASSSSAWAPCSSWPISTSSIMTSCSTSGRWP